MQQAAIKPLIATPCYGGMLCLNYVTSVLRLRAAFWQLGIAHDFYLRSGESLITRARNDCVAHFLAGDWTHLLWIDADQGFEPGAIVRLLQCDHDLVAGVCPQKRDDTTFVIDVDRLGLIDADGFAEASEAGTGIMRIKRDVFTRLADAYPELRYRVPGEADRHRFFDTMIDPENGQYLSEDYAFCRLWRALGGKVHVDANSDFSHQGTKVWRADFRQYLQSKGRSS